MRIQAVVFLAVALGITLAEAAPRKWTSADGKSSIQAEVLSVSNGKVELRKLNGDTVQVPLEKLSEADRQWVKTAFPQATEGSGEGVAAATNPASASCSLDLKRIELSGSASGSKSAIDAYRRLCNEQHAYFDIVTNSSTPRPSRESLDFKRVITKEPAKYNSGAPFRGVVRFNRREYGFVFDTSGPASFAYDRLYFDANGNGDLTDASPITGEIKGQRGWGDGVFPRVDLPIEIDGQKVNYAFVATVFCRASEQSSYANASFTPAVYREGRITVGGRKRHVVLLDSNTNGLFGDEARVSGMVGHPFVDIGDTLLFDPEATTGPTRSGIWGFMEGKCYVSKTIALDGTFYDCQLTPAGDRLTLSPSTIPIGYISNPNGFTAVVHSDRGTVMTITGNKGRVSLPEGAWRLVSYAMDQFAMPARSSTPGRQPKTKKSARAESPPAVLAASAAGVRGVVLRAEGTNDSPVVQVRKGETMPFPFGPPYKAVVTCDADQRAKSGNVRLSLVMTGCGGERCTSLSLGNSPRLVPLPFIIVNGQGEVVHRAQFEVGFGCMWRVPPQVSGEFHVQIQLGAVSVPVEYQEAIIRL
jgi:hypothetical protein